MKVPFLDLNQQYKEIQKSANVSLKKLFARGDFVLGKDVVEFENSFARFLNVRYAVGVNSGTDALFLGLLSLGIKPQDEVIVPAFTYIASAYAVTYTGAIPVFVDIDEKTYNIDPSKIEKAITSNTKAIMPVHLYGQSADMDAILKIAQKHNLKIIEDAAQAHGAQYHGRRVGALGDLGAFSFYPTKNLGAFGDGGMVVTNKTVLFEKLTKLRDYGRTTKYEHDSIGYNSRLDSLQAVFLKEKLKRLEHWNQKRIQAAHTYKKLLKDVNQIQLPFEDPNSKHIYHVFGIRVKNRDFVVDGLKNAGIGALVHYPVPLHLQEVYRSLGYKIGDCPVAERVCREIISLPIYPHIKKAQIEYVAKKLKGLVQND